MNFKTILIGLLSLLFVACSSSDGATNLRVDYVRLPELTQINSEAPIFSWLISPLAGAQSAYQIIVSSDAKCREADMWDSGKVTSDNSHAVSYGGAPLLPSHTYYWRVKYWDSEGVERPISDVQMFAMSSGEGQTIVTDNPLLRRKDVAHSPRQIGEGEYQFDFGKAAFGTLSFDLTVSQASELTIRVGEQLTSEGVIERQPKGTIRYQEHLVNLAEGESLYDVIFNVDKRNTGPMAIPVPEEWGVIMPFRYVEVSGLGANNVETMKLYRDVMYGYKEPLGRFSSSNELLDSIWEICKYTIEATDFLGYYIDGDRERIPYEADAYINQLCHYCVDAEYAIGKKSLEYFMSHATWPTEWLLHTIMIAYQDYIYTGDTRLVTKYYDTLKAKTLYELGREDGLINAKSDLVTPEYLLHIGFKKGAKRMADIVDWPMAAFTKGAMEMGERDGHEMMPINTVVNVFHYQALKQMGELAAVVGREDDSVMFADLAQKVKATINAKLFDPQLGVYVDGEGSAHSSLHSNMMPLAFGIVEAENVRSVAEFVKSRGMACSVYGAQYLFEALYNAGEGQYALDLMTNRTDRGWYNMISVGSTMTLEAWDIKYKGNLDWNHAWGAAPANLIPRHMWGITPTSAGYKSACVKPQLADLELSEISVPTLHGAINGSYTNVDGVKKYIVELPANMTATFECVDCDVSITLNGEVVESQTVALAVGENVIVVEKK
ncbi:MAG: family 78 glycoside hydrolase catalytic domain [Rikenellaceae bacterium]